VNGEMRRTTVLWFYSGFWPVRLWRGDKSSGGVEKHITFRYR